MAFSEASGLLWSDHAPLGLSVVPQSGMIDSWLWRPRVVKQKQKKKVKGSANKFVLRLPDLEIAESAVLGRLSNPDAQRGYRHAIDEFVDWYCSEPRLSFGKTVVVRYRMHLESRQLAPGTITLRWRGDIPVAHPGSTGCREQRTWQFQGPATVGPIGWCVLLLSSDAFASRLVASIATSRSCRPPGPRSVRVAREPAGS